MGIYAYFDTAPRITGRRGFGAPQILGLIVIALVAIILAVVSLSNFSNESTIRASAFTEMTQTRAHMVLHNTIMSPMQNPPLSLTRDVDSPTIGDFIATQDLSNTTNRLLLGEEMAKIIDGMDDTAKGRFSTYAIYLDNAELYRPNKKDRYPGFTIKSVESMCSADESKNNERLSEAELRIPTAKGDRVLKLKYCWVRVNKK